MSSPKTVVFCTLLAMLALCGCGHEEPRPAAPTETVAPAPAPAPASAGDPAPAPAPVETSCETPSDCEARTRVCPRPHPHHVGNCVRPYTTSGEHLLGLCQEVSCEVDDDAECQQAAARCVGGGTGTFRAYDPPDPDYRVGSCTVRCNAYPEAN